MTPAARIDAAIGILDDILGGGPAEKVLTNWARRSRFAGSGDRAAVRDLVFDALRCRRSLGWLGGGDTGRALMLGRVKAAGEDAGALFTGARHAPPPPSDAERETPASLDDAPAPVRLDVPDWLFAPLNDALGERTEAVLDALRTRAPVTLRVNLARTSRAEMLNALRADGFEAVAHDLAQGAIVVGGNTRALSRHAAFEAGLFEFQDAAPQAAVEDLAPLLKGAEVLDYCAGGGGKSLAIAALGAGRVVAHDAAARRMDDLKVRAERAGVSIETTSNPEGPFDIVVCDVPCSGSGAWRRQPDAKWRLTESGLDALIETQRKIIDAALPLVRPSGHLVYMTCSLLVSENEDQVRCALERWDELSALNTRHFTPLDGGDGFFTSVLQRVADPR